MTYHIVHQLHKDGLSISRISEELVLDWRTVKKYLSMTEQSYESFLQEQSERKKGLEPYEAFIKARLSKYPDTSAAQMHDWLKEHYADFPAVNSKTVFNFVCWVRQKYHLQKASAQREYAMVAECGYGAQAQADFGEYTLRSSQGKQVKVYFWCWFWPGHGISMYSSPPAVLLLRQPYKPTSRLLASLKAFPKRWCMIRIACFWLVKTMVT